MNQLNVTAIIFWIICTGVGYLIGATYGAVLGMVISMSVSIGLTMWEYFK